MTPNFALSLSFDAITLLRRVGPRWARIEEVSLDHEDFDPAVIALRDRAESLDPNGAQVALVIPNEQIRYLDQPDMGGDEAARDVAIRAALDGETPYKVDALTWDHLVTGGRLQIAAVASETLDEAQNFAREHGFEPVCFMARAPEGAFDGAVLFGKAEGWKRAVNRPPRPIEIVPAGKAALTPVVGSDAVEAGPSRPPAPDVAAARPGAETDPVRAEQQAQPEPAALTDAGADGPAAAAAPEPARAQAPSGAPLETATGPSAQRPAPQHTPEFPARDDAAQADSAPAHEQEPAIASAVRKDPRSELDEQPAPEVTASTENAPGPDDQPAADVSTREEAAPDQDERTAAPGTFSSLRASRGGMPASPASSTGPVATEGLKPRFTPVVSPVEEDRAKAPAAEKTEGKTGFFGKPTASAILAKAQAAVAELEENERAKPLSEAPKALPPKPLAATPKKPPMGTQKKPLTAPDKLPPKAAVKKPPLTPGKSAGKTPSKQAPGLAAARAAALAAAPPPAPKDDLMALAANGGAGTPVSKPGQPKVVPPKRPAAQPNPLAKLAKLRDAKAKTPSAPAKKPAAAASPAPGTAFNTSSERDRMTIFGARDRDTIGGKPRYLGLMLTGVLLVFLVGVAAWASLFLDDGLARLFRTQPAAPAVAARPEVDPAPAAPGDEEGVVLESLSAVPAEAVEPETPPVSQPEDDAENTTLETAADEPPDPLAAPMSEPARPEALTPQEAAATYAATGIWQRAPAAPMTPPADGVDDVYSASIDPDIQIFDAVALPDPAPMAPEANLADPGLPPPADLTFEFDERDLIRATSEGALTPDGLRVFTGRPPVVPPLRDASGSLAPQVRDPGTIVARVEAMPRIRPEARPGDIIEQRERAELSGNTLDELGDFRPVMRPTTVQEQAEIDAPDATDEAVARSLIPVGRPRDMASIVDNADHSLAPQPAQAAPRTVAPSVPSSASVARAATSENAINLGRINLIGIYGTPQNRRALVRLANGKYQKVKVGDRLDGGRITAIGEETLRYTKGGRNLTLDMPRG